jgi:hypothetical protein
MLDCAVDVGVETHGPEGPHAVRVRKGLIEAEPWSLQPALGPNPWAVGAVRRSGLIHFEVDDGALVLSRVSNDCCRDRSNTIICAPSWLR